MKKAILIGFLVILSLALGVLIATLFLGALWGIGEKRYAAALIMCIGAGLLSFLLPWISSRNENRFWFIYSLCVVLPSLLLLLSVLKNNSIAGLPLVLVLGAGIGGGLLGQAQYPKNKVHPTGGTTVPSRNSMPPDP